MAAKGYYMQRVRKHWTIGIVLLFTALILACGSSATAIPETSAPSSPSQPAATSAPAATSVPSAAVVPPASRPTPLPVATRAPVTELKASGTLNHGVAETGIFQGHPTEASSPRVQYMSSSIGEGLVTIGQDLQPNPMIATSWDVSEDFLEWTWKIRDDVDQHLANLAFCHCNTVKRRGNNFTYDNAAAAFHHLKRRSYQRFVIAKQKTSGGETEMCV